MKLINSLETWIGDKRNQDRLKKYRWIDAGYCQQTKVDRIRNTERLERGGIQTAVVDTTESRQRRWYGHLRRISS